MVWPIMKFEYGRRAARPSQRKAWSWRAVDGTGGHCLNRKQWALNSAVECHPHTVEVVGSNPTAPTIHPPGCDETPTNRVGTTAPAVQSSAARQVMRGGHSCPPLLTLTLRSTGLVRNLSDCEKRTENSRACCQFRIYLRAR